MTWLDQFASEAGAEIPETVRETLWGRGVSDEQIAAFRIGYVDHELPQILLPENFVRWAGDKISECLVFPITNSIGEIRGLQFRHVERSRSGYMDYLPDQEEAVGFGLAHAMSPVWGCEEIIIVEGAFDLLPVQRFVPHVVATLTARVTETYVRLLRRLVRRVWIWYDNDSTGDRAYQKFRQHYGVDFDIQRLRCPKVSFGGKLVKDPGELWEAWGDAQFGQYLRSAVGTHKLE